LAVSYGKSLSTSEVDAFKTFANRSLGVIVVLLSEEKYAMIPATCGVAIEVPLIVLVAFGDPIHVERIDRPGAKISVNS